MLALVCHDTLLIHVIEPDGNYYCVQLESNTEKGEQFQFVVRATAWFCAAPVSLSNFVLTSCTVSPGFDFSDFILADQNELLKKFPRYKDILTFW